MDRAEMLRIAQELGDYTGTEFELREKYGNTVGAVIFALTHVHRKRSGGAREFLEGKMTPNEMINLGRVYRHVL